MRFTSLSLAAILMLPGVALGLSVTAVPSTTKVLKDGTAPAGSPSVSIEGARNEYEAFQLILRAGAAPSVDVTADMSDLVGPGGTVIPSSAATLYLEYYVDITFPSPCDIFFSYDCDKYPAYSRTPGWYPDALIPFLDPYSQEHSAVGAPFDVPAGDLQTVFVDVHIPPDVAAGEYSGTVSIFAGGTVASELPIVLTVWDFDMPVERHVGTAYGFGHGSLDGFHGAPGGLTTEEREAIFRNYDFEIHRHRLDYTTYSAPVPFEYDDQGNLIGADFAEYDAFMGPRMSGSYYPDGAGVARFNVGMFSPGHGTMGMTDAQFSTAAKIVALHLQGKGWLDNAYLYSLDEPWLLQNWRNGSYDAIKNGVDLLNSQTDLWSGHVLVTGPWQPVLDGYVDIYCPVTPMYGDVFWPPGSWPGPAKYADLLAQGRELWFYVCNANFPGQLGYDVDARLGYEPRLVKWGAWSEGATGFLYWSIQYWQSQDPWHVLINLPQFGDQFSRQGDGILIYPGGHSGSLGTGSPEGVELDGPVVSFRLKQVRDGLEDWEMFILAASLGQEEWTRTQVSRAYSAFGAALNETFDYSNPPWTLDEAVMLDSRRQVALKIQHVLHPDSWPDPEPGPVPDPHPEPESDVVEQFDAAEVLGADVAVTCMPDTAGACPPGTPDGSSDHGKPAPDAAPDGSSGDVASGDTSATGGNSGSGCAASPGLPASSPTNSAATPEAALEAALLAALVAASLTVVRTRTFGKYLGARRSLR